MRKAICCRVIFPVRAGAETGDSENPINFIQKIEFLAEKLVYFDFQLAISSTTFPANLYSSKKLQYDTFYPGILEKLSCKFLSLHQSNEE